MEIAGLHGEWVQYSSFWAVNRAGSMVKVMVGIMQSEYHSNIISYMAFINDWEVLCSLLLQYPCFVLMLCMRLPFPYILAMGLNDSSYSNIERSNNWVMVRNSYCHSAYGISYEVYVVFIAMELHWLVDYGWHGWFFFFFLIWRPPSGTLRRYLCLV
jgi:hypothetical protein